MLSSTTFNAIIDALPKKLEEHFTNYILHDAELVSLLYSMIQEHADEYELMFQCSPQTPSSFSDVVWLSFYSLDYFDEASPSSVITDSLNKIRKTHYNTKNYWSKRIIAEYNEFQKDGLAKKNGMLITYIQACNIPGSKVDIMRAIASEATIYMKNPDSFLIDYKFYGSIGDSRRISFYLTDIGNCIANIVLRDWYGSLTGYRTRIGYSTQDGIFHLPMQRNTLEARPVLSEDGVIQLVSEKFSTPDGQSLQYIFSEEDVPQDVSLSILESPGTLELMAEKYNWSLKSEPLNASDAVILNFIYNKITMYNIIYAKPIHFQLLELRNYLGQESYHRDVYERLLTSLFKLSNYQLRYEDNTSQKDTARYHLFDIEVIRNDARMAYTECIVMPSNYMMDKIQRNRDEVVLTRLYKSLPTSQGKLIFTFFQSLRIKNLVLSGSTDKPCVVKIPMGTLQLSFRVSSLRTLKRTLEPTLMFMLEHEIGICEYSFEKKYLSVTFLPLNNIERGIYDGNGQKNDMLLLAEPDCP